MDDDAEGDLPSAEAETVEADGMAELAEVSGGAPAEFAEAVDDAAHAEEMLGEEPAGAEAEGELPFDEGGAEMEVGLGSELAGADELGQDVGEEEVAEPRDEGVDGDEQDHEEEIVRQLISTHVGEDEYPDLDTPTHELRTESYMDGTLRPGSAGAAEEDPEEYGMLDDDMQEEEEDTVDPIVELQEKYDQLIELHERAIQHNNALQRRVIQRKAQDKFYDSSEKQSEGKVTEHKYQNVLNNVHSVRLKLRLQQVKAARMSEELKNQLESKRQKAIECRDSFQEFKRQVARHAEYARTGKKIPEKIIQEVEEFELDKDAEVEEVRGSSISLKNRLAKLEQALRKKDELAENLHVIDFEQLKIENQTLNEKIEERNEELHKLRKKTVVTVQIITHMREKVQFVQQEYQVLKTELAQLDQDLAAQRDLVAKTKHERDDHRADFLKLKQQSGIMNSEQLTKDFEERAKHVKDLKDSIAQLKKRHGQMLAFIKSHGGRL